LDGSPSKGFFCFQVNGPVKSVSSIGSFTIIAFLPNRAYCLYINSKTRTQKMTYTRLATLLKYMMVSMFMVFPAISADARTGDDAGKETDIPGTVLAPIDRSRPAVFETASFGLG
jgi:hypothetical protein